MLPGKRGHQYGTPALDQPVKWHCLGDSEDSIHRGGEEKARPPSTSSYVSNSEQHFIISIVLNFQTPGLIQILLQLKQTFQSQRYMIFEYMNQISFKTACAFPYFKKKLTGLLIQSMSALSDRDSSGPKSVTGWASTLELCFLLSMLKSALASKYKTAVWEQKERVVLVT